MIVINPNKEKIIKEQYIFKIRLKILNNKRRKIFS